MTDGLVNPDEPSVARYYDYLLGGSSALPPDIKLAEQIIAAYPGAQRMAINSRRFLARATAWTTQRGSLQDLDLGGGMPTRGTPSYVDEHGQMQTAEITPLHEAAQAAAGDQPIRYVYVDLDAIAVSHAQAAGSAPGSVVTALRADIGEPESVLTAPEVTGTLDLTRPVTVILGMVLHFFDAAEAKEVVRAYASALAPGSYVVVSIGHNDDADTYEQARTPMAAASAGDLYNHSHKEILGFLDSLELVPPGLVLARAWRGGWDRAAVEHVPAAGSAYALGAVARKP